jgi:hypothetical protein
LCVCGGGGLKRVGGGGGRLWVKLPLIHPPFLNQHPHLAAGYSSGSEGGSGSNGGGGGGAAAAAPSGADLDFDRWCELGLPPALLAACAVCRSGVKRAHLVDCRVDGGLLLELYSRDGVGCMISTDFYEGIRPAGMQARTQPAPQAACRPTPPPPRRARAPPGVSLWPPRGSRLPCAASSRSACTRMCTPTRATPAPSTSTSCWGAGSGRRPGAAAPAGGARRAGQALRGAAAQVGGGGRGEPVLVAWGGRAHPPNHSIARHGATAARPAAVHGLQVHAHQLAPPPPLPGAASCSTSRCWSGRARCLGARR